MKKKNKKKCRNQSFVSCLRVRRVICKLTSPCNVSQFPASQIRTRKFPGQRAVRIPRLAPIVPDKRTTRRNERTQPCFLDERERERGLHRGCLPHPLLGPRHIQVELNEESRATAGRQKISSSRRQRISFSTRCSLSYIRRKRRELSRVNEYNKGLVMIINQDGNDEIS